jgi:Fe-S oxidoreductase
VLRLGRHLQRAAARTRLPAARPQAGAAATAAAAAIVSANIGCIQHLQSGTATPVRHWVEVLDEALAG